MIKECPSLEELNKLFLLDYESGYLYWKKRSAKQFNAGNEKNLRSAMNCWNTRFAGKKAFTAIDSGGYYYGAIYGGLFRAHRIIFKMANGIEPKIIDHEDGDTLNNKPSNLRSVDHQGNSSNLRLSSNNTSGVVGVHLGLRNKWVARIWHGGRHYHLGQFATKHEAAEARRLAQIRFGFHPNHGKRRDSVRDLE